MLDSNGLANFSVFAPAIVGSKWRSCSFIHGLIAGLYIGYGWIHTIQDCAFKNNAVANLYLDKDANAVNVLDNNFVGGSIGIIANYGEVLRIVGNCFQDHGGPAIYANQMGALTISSSYYEANNMRAASFKWVGQEWAKDLCADVVLNGAGQKEDWRSDPARLAALVERGPDGTFVLAPQRLASDNYVAAAIIEGAYHNPDHSACPSRQFFGVYVAGGEGVTVRNNDCRVK